MALTRDNCTENVTTKNTCDFSDDIKARLSSRLNLESVIK